MLLTGNFGLLDWGIVIGYLVITTIIGERLAGKQATIREFFLGGRKLPWYAVAGSNIATEISAVTFVSVPFVVYKDGGNFTYLQFGLIGSLLARLIVGYVLVPAYFKKEIYSPYDYMANQLGAGVKNVCSALFAFGGILAQAARVYLTAIVLRLALGESVLRPLEEATGFSSLTLSIWFLGFVAIVWTILGGITTVIWTDVILFFVFLLGGLVALGSIASRLDGGLSEILAVGDAAGKFQFFDWSPDPTRTYTVWVAAIAVTWGNVGAFGTDQLMAQRMFCCKNEKEARWAVIAAAFGQVFTAIMMLVGVGLFAFYRANPLSGDALHAVEEKGDSIFPVFILNEVPSGLSGLIIAGIFAAAISSLDGILSALSQTAMSTLYEPWRKKHTGRNVMSDSGNDPEEDRRAVFTSRVFVVIAGIVLCSVAAGMDTVARNYKSILDLALSLATYSQGGLLAAFLLAFLPLKRDGSGLVWSVPLSCLAVFALNWQPRVQVDEDARWPMLVCAIGGLLLLAMFVVRELHRREGRSPNFPLQAVVFAATVAFIVWLSLNAHFDLGPIPDGPPGAHRYASLAFPWHAPIGCVIAFTLGFILGRPRQASPDPP